MKRQAVLALTLAGALALALAVLLYVDHGTGAAGAGSRAGPPSVVAEPQVPPVPSLPAVSTASAEPIVTARTIEAKRPIAAPQVDRWQALYDSLVAQHPAAWAVTPTGIGGDWGTTDLATGLITLSRATPLGRLDDVMRHEWIHARQYQVYGWGAVDAMAPYAVRGVPGYEVVADCGARALGATWTRYVRSCTAEQARAGRAMIAGVPA